MFHLTTLMNPLKFPVEGKIYEQYYETVIAYNNAGR